MSKKLTLEDRYHISMYCRRLPCTLQLRFAIDAFLDQIEITAEEVKTNKIEITATEFKCANPDDTKEFDDFPAPVTDAMKGYIETLDHEKNKDSVMLHKTFDYFRKAI